MPSVVSRRRFLAALVTSSLSLPNAGWGADEKSTLEILVDKRGWGAASPSNIQTVLLSTAREIWRNCTGQLLRPIRVYHREDFPMTDFLHDWRGRIRIGLACEDAHWAQMAFQFGHEFCHALAQHSAAAKRSWHPPRHANLWFEECLCETGSLFVLRRLATTWKTEPPYPQWRPYAAAMGDYATERLARPDHQLPESTPFAAWFQSNEAALRENHTLRAKNVIIARQILPLFEANPAGWETLCYLNLGKREHGKPFAQHLAEWSAATPAELRPFVSQIAARFNA